MKRPADRNQSPGAYGSRTIDSGVGTTHGPGELQMARDRQTIGNCPNCGGDELVCSYNHFGRDDLTIDSWEHKCASCGYRETKAFRSDEEETRAEGADPTECPYCGRHPS